MTLGQEVRWQWAWQWTENEDSVGLNHMQYVNIGLLSKGLCNCALETLCFWMATPKVFFSDLSEPSELLIFTPRPTTVLLPCQPDTEPPCFSVSFWPLWLRCPQCLPLRAVDPPGPGRVWPSHGWSCTGRRTERRPVPPTAGNCRTLPPCGL